MLLFAISAIAQSTCTRHVESAGRFSYCPPAGWAVKDSASGGPYKSFFTPDGAAVRANMNVKESATTLALNDFMASELMILLADNETAGGDTRKIIGWTQFTTDSNIKGSRVVYETTYKGVLLRMVQYVLDFPGKKLVITGTALMSNKDTIAKVFDAVAKTVKLIP